MENRFLSLLLCSVLLIFSCSDGDVFDVELDFDDTFKACEESKLLFFKTKEDPTESLSLLFDSFKYETLFEISEEPLSFTGGITEFNNENASFIYRTYNRPDLPDDTFCSLIPPADLNIQINENDPSVDVTIIRDIIEDDNDGILARFEGPKDASGNYINPLDDDDGDGVLNFRDDDRNNENIKDDNGEIETGFDTDGDGLPNFMDEDDDGDNVLTKDENPDPNGDGNPSDAQNTDFDEEGTEKTPDYLDEDDDNDGVPTINEESLSQDQNPFNDQTFPDLNKDYLTKSATATIEATAYRQHRISRTYNITVDVENINISFLLQTRLNFGTLNNTGTSEFKLSEERTATPVFP